MKIITIKTDNPANINIIQNVCIDHNIPFEMSMCVENTNGIISNNYLIYISIEFYRDLHFYLRNVDNAMGIAHMMFDSMYNHFMNIDKEV